ncbi:MAG: metal ABC transporter permease [Candidatus Andersenbacteria bacterium]|nr:metal ABC transporter permease [Candidatus Andersenbacteria bacterium]MBI3251168.1 metal ABC transporter permease [Candidatus Andersenbacteria bacterium]
MIEILTLPFFQRALLVGLMLGSMMAVFGVLVLLRRMSFFADAIGHSALAGIAIGLLVGIDPFVGGLVFAVAVALGIAGVRRISTLPLDTLLAVFFSASVALGVVLITLSPGYQADLISFLFGNILTVTNADVVLSFGMMIITGGVLLWVGKGLVAIALDASLAKAEGVPVGRYELLLLILLAVTIALSIKVVGIVLVTALLIIPAAAAHNISRSLAGMFGWSVVVSIVSVVVGLLASAVLDTPSGPTIVLTGSIIFAISLVTRRLSGTA